MPAAIHDCGELLQLEANLYLKLHSMITSLGINWAEHCHTEMLLPGIAMFFLIWNYREYNAGLIEINKMFTNRQAAVATIVAAPLFFLIAGCSEAEMANASSENGLETITGTYVGQGVICPQMQLDSGEKISLSGAYPKQLQSGDALSVKGRWAPESKCMQGREFRVFK